MEGTDARVAGMLTPEQKQRYLAIRTRQGPGRANMRPGGMGNAEGSAPALTTHGSHGAGPRG